MVMVMKNLLPPPLCNVYRPSHSEIQLFQNLTMVKVMCVVKGQGHVWPSKFKSQGYGQGQTHWSHLRPGVQSICLLFIPWQSDHFWLRYSKFYIWPWKFKVKVMAKGCKLLNKPTLVNLYYTFVYPYYIYGIHVWGGTYPTNLQKLVLLQKKAIRIITCSKYMAGTQNLFKQYRLLRLPELYKYLVGIFVYKFDNMQLPVIFSSFYAKVRAVHLHDIRTADNYRLINIKLNVRKHSMKFSRAAIWNMIPWVYGCPNLLKFLRISIKDIFMIQIWNEMIMNSIQYFLNFDNLLFHWATASILASSVDICILIDLLTYCNCDVFSERVKLHHLLTQLCCHSMAR